MVALLSRVLLCATVLGALAFWQRPDGRLHVVFLETKGDAALIQTPAGTYVLVDGGEDPAGLATMLGRRMPFWQRTLGAVILTAPNRGRLAGQVAALARYRADVALAPPALPQSALAREWLRLLSDGRTPVRNARVGTTLAVGGATIRVVAAGDEGIALAVAYGATTVLLDFGGAAATMPPSALRPISALAYPWERPPPLEQLAVWKPKALVFTTGYQANKPVLLTTDERGAGRAATYHPKLNGAIELVSDGRQLSVHTER